MTPTAIAKAAAQKELNKNLGMICNQNEEITLTESDLLMVLENAVMKALQHREELLDDMSPTTRQSVEMKVW